MSKEASILEPAFRGRRLVRTSVSHHHRRNLRQSLGDLDAFEPLAIEQIFLLPVAISPHAEHTMARAEAKRSAAEYLRSDFIAT